MDFMDKVTLDDLDGEQREIAELIELDVYKRLAYTYGGSAVYINKADTIVRGIRDQCIRDEYTGYNMSDLIRKYGISESSIRNIVKAGQGRTKKEKT